MLHYVLSVGFLSTLGAGHAPGALHTLPSVTQLRASTWGGGSLWADEDPEAKGGEMTFHGFTAGKGWGQSSKPGPPEAGIQTPPLATQVSGCG